MAGLSNKDSSFFEIQSPDVSIDDLIMTKDLISLTIVEEMGKLPVGTIQLYDPNFIYARILRTGVSVNLAWGYKNADVSVQQNLANILNLDEFKGTIERRGLQMMCLQPSGGASVNSLVHFNANLMAIGLRGEDQVRVFRSGTKGSVVRQVLTEMGVAIQDVRFERQLEVITSETEIRQWESNFAFLTRMASREWRTLFSMNYTPSGKLAAVFIDPWLIGTSAYQKFVTGGSGGSNYLDYKGQVSNVISYNWTNNEGEQGQGQNVRMLIVDGKATFVRYVVQDDKVITYQLRPDRIKEEFDRKGTDSGFLGQTELLKDFLSVKDFVTIERFFDPIEEKTAPQGLGYKVNARMFGNPMITASNIAKFGQGFPDQIGSSSTKWYIRQVVHTINRDGYFMEVEIADAYTLTPTGVLL